MDIVVSLNKLPRLVVSEAEGSLTWSVVSARGAYGQLIDVGVADDD